MDARIDRMTTPYPLHPAHPCYYFAMRLDIIDHIATITLSRPGAGNAIDELTAQQLRDACDVIRQDDDACACAFSPARTACSARAPSSTAARRHLTNSTACV